MIESDNQPGTDATSLARWLGYAGLIPFVAGTVLLVGGHVGVREFALEGLIAYAAVILSFMGAVHWGRAMFALSGSDARKAFVISVLPALAGWVATFLTARLALAILAGAFTLLYFYDRATVGAAGGYDWYLQLRLRLTSIVVVCLLLCLVLL